MEENKKRTLQHEGYYVCKCGREFTKSQSFNAHKSHCIEILGKEKYEARLEQTRQSAIKGGAKQKEIKAEAKQTVLDIWLSKKHKCERCGKIMTEYFGSGRFCSVTCANTRIVTEEQKTNIGEKN